MKPGNSFAYLEYKSWLRFSWNLIMPLDFYCLSQLTPWLAMKEQSTFFSSSLVRDTRTRIPQKGGGEWSFWGAEFASENENTNLVSQFLKKMNFRTLENQKSKTQKIIFGLRMEFEVYVYYFSLFTKPPRSGNGLWWNQHTNSERQFVFPTVHSCIKPGHTPAIILHYPNHNHIDTHLTSSAV